MPSAVAEMRYFEDSVVGKEFASTIEYEVTVDGTLLFSKKALGRFPDDGEVIRLIEAR